MWLALASTSPRALKITDVLKSDRVDVTKHFLIHFEKYWKKERYECVVCPFYFALYPVLVALITFRMDRNYFGDQPARVESVEDPPSPPKPPMPRRLSLNLPPAPKTKTLQRRASVQTSPTGTSGTT
ncbi:hypothetical protein JG687_00005880 [Phytophthora cactorum]|uniref:Uncharacterized protein n=1 Tax=Phytophthora cactorum TaxID=29920 RepID=A0A8T1UL24_9STRA|nr:hypothetical protein GQ600_6710 [Phytophthora cactorum]KAG6964602.1 hypothetical protein JG687_00005880 [Phytophthora cactorum]